MISLVMIILLAIVLFKPVFYGYALFVSAVWVRVLMMKNKSDKNSSALTTGGGDGGKNKARGIIKHHIGGLLFYSLMKTGAIPSHAIRNVFYKYLFKIKMGKDAVIYGGAEIRAPHKLTIGQGSIIGHYSVLDARNTIEIGRNVNFSHGVWLWTEQHNYNSADFGCESSRPKKITIHDRVWLGPRVIVLPGCTIGEGAVVGAGAIVTKDIEPFSVNVGIPARKVGERNRNLTYVLRGGPLWFV